MDIAFRPLTATDRAPIAALLGRIPQFTAEDVDVALELVDEVVERPDATSYRALVATSGAAGVVGYACYGRTPMTETTWDLYWIVVDPAAQGGGIGRGLWAATERHVRSEGGRLVRIETSSTELYAGTQAFYARVGLREHSRIADFYRAGDDLITYVARL